MKKSINTTQSLQTIHQSYCSYDKATVMMIHKISESSLDKLVKKYGWKRPVYKLPQVCRDVKYGRHNASRYPHLDFSLLNQPPQTVYEFLNHAAQYDYIAGDVLSLLTHFPGFPSIGNAYEEIKFMRKLIKMDPTLASPFNMVINEFKLVS